MRNLFLTGQEKAKEVEGIGLFRWLKIISESKSIIDTVKYLM